ncbi:TrbI F-type domain-containing protein [Vibrio vulnificus]|uniref:TrbI F-type domain-containing protein n=1 Tax=Vibrio vulnificus TaxID=672 RepID=UPI003026F981
MNIKHLFFGVTYTALVLAAAVGAQHYFTEKPKPTKEIVTVDLQKLVRAKAEAISKSEQGDTPSRDAQLQLAAYTEDLNERITRVAEEAGVVIFVKQAVVAGAYRDITPLLMEQ